MKDASIMLKSETKVKWYTFLSPVIWEIFVWLPIYAALKFFLRMEIHEQKNLQGVAFPYILASNHTSELDPVAIKAIFGPLPPFIPVFYVARESSFYKKKGIQSFFYGGPFFELWGAFAARVGANDYEVSLKTHIDILLLRKRSVMCVFPEGNKTRDGNLLPAKGGVAYLATRTNTPIVPIAMDGVFKMTKKEFLLRKRKLVIVVGKPIYPDALFDGLSTTPGDCKKAAQRVIDTIARLLRKQFV